MSIEITGFFGFLLFILSVWAIIKTVESRASTGTKVLWTVVILLLPVLGLIFWFFLGPRKH
ncbi:MAG: PLD nuclease N-terminal domain-containing protein [Gammaproteobacteria bacterium]|nr:PLD nuclease N-terminal domain-containing protein [Gammaproteobacteria bacterium]